MKFYRGKKQKYNAELHSDGLYFAHEDNNSSTIIANDHEFGTNYTEVTWQKLKDLRDNSLLIPGSLYRITDYLCTTTQENTQSAGHQFDIVLLALSENKLAEEGWAMMHDNIYDVAFNDGITKKCYIYQLGEDEYNIIDINTLLGYEASDEGSFSEDSTFIAEFSSGELAVPNLTYNYFQNSNLSAWKVWYCLDNDTARFAWADLGSIQIIENGSPLPISREPSSDTTKNSIRYYAWLRKGFGGGSDVTLYTTSETPLIGDSIYQNIGGMIPTNTVKEVINNPEGTGVIYRLIDEWGNNIPYDFKNIQFYNDGLTHWVYAIIDENNLEEDPTLDGIRVKAIHLLSNYNNSLRCISKSRLSNDPLINVIFLNNSNMYTDGASDTLVRDGHNIQK